LYAVFFIDTIIFLKTKLEFLQYIPPLNANWKIIHNNKNNSILYVLSTPSAAF